MSETNNPTLREILEMEIRNNRAHFKDTGMALWPPMYDEGGIFESHSHLLPQLRRLHELNWEDEQTPEILAEMEELFDKLVSEIPDSALVSLFDAQCCQKYN